MRTHPIRVTVLAAALAWPASATAAELTSRLAPLAFLVGKTWRGTFPESKPDKPVVDVSRFEVALNGQAVRNLHSINDGEYGGNYLAMESFRYAVTKSEDARVKAGKSFRFLKFLQEE